MSPRRSVAAARDTREAIVKRAVDVASTDGLEGLSFGKLADGLQMSKAGVAGHFGSKEALQLAALEEAVAVFERRVWQPAAHHSPGLERLLATAQAWTEYLGGDCFPGGCFLTAAAAEFDGRPGPLRDALAANAKRWRWVLIQEVEAAAASGELPADTDPGQVAFELAALAAGANQDRQLHGDELAAPRALKAMRRVLSA